MQSYRTEESHAEPSSYASGGGLSSAMNRREDDIGKYKDRYEESMNPFEAFKGRVSTYLPDCLQRVRFCSWSDIP